MVDLPTSDVEAQLQKILQSPAFRSAPRHSRFLAFVVRKALAGQADSVKEYSIGLEVFDREADFDPAADPVVRSEARRLRFRLAEYYRTHGTLDPIHIDLPKGTYVPVFSRNGIAPPSVETNAEEPPIGRSDNLIVPRAERAASRRNKWRFAAWALAFSVPLCVLAGYGAHVLRARMGRSGPLPASAAQVKVRRSVAVMGFTNLSQQQEAAWLSTALSEMLTTELGTGDKLMTIPDQTVARAKTELKLDGMDGLSSDTLGRVRQNLGADVVVSGAYTVLPTARAAQELQAAKVARQIRLDLRVQNAVSGETLQSVSETGKESDLFAMVARAGARVRQLLGVEELATTEAAEARFAVTANAQALRLYSEGMSRLHNFDSLGARDLLQQAVQADPQFGLAYSALADVWTSLGYDAKAERAAKKAYELSGKLNREQRLFIEGRYREASHDWERAIAAYCTLFDFFPDNVEYGLKLADAQEHAAKPLDALKTTQALEALPLPLSDDPRIDLAVAEARHVLGDVSRVEAAADRAIAKARQRGSLLVIAQAELLETGWAAPQHDLTTDRSRAEDAKRICESLDDLDCEAQALWEEGWVDNNNQASLRLYKEALRLFTRVGDLRGAVNAQIGIGRLLEIQGREQEAREVLDQAQRICETIADKSCLWKAVLQQGNTYYQDGNLPAAEQRFKQGLVITRQTGDSKGIAWALANLAQTSQLEGELSEALELSQQSTETNRQHGSPGELGMSYGGSVLLDQGRIVEARRLLEKSLSFAGASPASDVGDASGALALVDLAEHRPAEAETRLRPSAEYWERTKRTPHAAYHYAILAQSLLAQNKVAEAQATVIHARALLHGKRDGLIPLYLTVTEASVTVAAKPHDRQTAANALASLRQVISQCRRNNMVSTEFEARLAEAQIEMQSGAVSAGRAHLASLERDAHDKGFDLIARQASAARQITLAQARRQ